MSSEVPSVEVYIGGVSGADLGRYNGELIDSDLYAD